MKYIDKHQFKREAHDINVKYLHDCYNNNWESPIPSPKDPNRSFEDFKKPKYREGDDGWKSLLLKEQDCRCCYCMRRLSSHINYEHIIPRSLTSENKLEVEYYKSKAKALYDLVEMADVFATKTFNSLDDISVETKMPHTIAISNLLAACNGKLNSKFSHGCCCNNSRGDSRMLPIMLMPECDDSVTYDENGILNIKTDDGTLQDRIDELNDETLQEIRSIWYVLSNTNRNMSEFKNYELKERIEWFKEAYKTDDFTKLETYVKRFVGLLTSEGDNKSSDFYWNLLMDYDWFYIYYVKFRE